MSRTTVTTAPSSVSVISIDFLFAFAMFIFLMLIYYFYNTLPAKIVCDLYQLAIIAAAPQLVTLLAIGKFLEISGRYFVE